LLIPINVLDDNLHSLATTFGCDVGQLSFTHTGLPLGVTKLTIQDLSPLVGLVECQLNASALFLRYGGRLEYVYMFSSFNIAIFLYVLSESSENYAKYLEQIPTTAFGQKRRTLLL
jgi:hypothetical protein